MNINSNKTQSYIIFGLILSVFILMNLFSTSDKEEITAIINQLEESLEYKKVLPPLTVASRLNKVKKLFSPDFSAKYVGFNNVKSLNNTNSMKGSALMAARYFSRIDILKLPLSIEVNHNKASASFKITISGQDTQGVEFKELFDIAAEFKKIDGEWYYSSIIASRLTPTK